MYVIYARKSSESEDRQVLSIDSQIHELQALASRRGLHVSDVLTESKSAKAPGRPVFGELMQRVRRGRIRGIICWKMDRLARNHLDTGAVLQSLADHKLEEVITSDRTYTPDGNDRFMGNFELGMATKYIDDLRANVKRGIRARLQRGWISHVPSPGYLTDPGTKEIVKDPERFDLIRRAMHLVVTGSIRPAQALTILNQQWGFQTRRTKRSGGKPLARARFYHMLRDPFYMGLIRLRSGETLPGAHPPMLTKEEFDRIQELLGVPGRPRPQRHEFAFTGLIRCGACGAMVTAEEHVKPSGRRYVYYRCTRNRTGKPCREPAISEGDLEEQLLAILQRVCIPPRALALVLRRVNGASAREAEVRLAARKMLEQSLAMVQREIVNLRSLRVRDLVDDQAFVAETRAAEERRAKLLTQLEAPPRSQDEIQAQTVETFRFAARAAQVLQSGTIVQRRMILRATGLNPEIASKKLRMLLKNPFQRIAEGASSHSWWACADDVRTWIQDTTEYFCVPDLDLVTTDSIQPQVRSHEKRG